MKNNKRGYFFWIERLQITRKERIVISILSVLIVVTVASTAFIKMQYTYSSQNYDNIRREFERKSALIEAKKVEDLKKYTAQNESADNKELNVQVTESVIININTADVEELQKLKGIGETYAQRIVDYRLENGEFKAVAELLNVKGIGNKRLEDIKAFIKLK